MNSAKVRLSSNLFSIWFSKDPLDKPALLKAESTIAIIIGG
ncbi:MAG: hypothetical protein ACE5KT_00405 [Methanosarcinales archaeon]